MIGRLAALTALAVLAGLSVWLTREVPEDTERDSLVRGTDGYFEGVEIRASDEQGRLRFRMSAARAEHDPLREGIVLSDVDVELLEAGVPAWSVVAAEGLAPTEGDWIELSGEVVMDRVRGADELRVTGASFTLFPEAERAESDQRVEVRMGAQVLTGTGFEADFDGGSMRLLADVHGRYADAS